MSARPPHIVVTSSNSPLFNPTFEGLAARDFALFMHDKKYVFVYVLTFRCSGE